jgi:hypothetical protein
LSRLRGYVLRSPDPPVELLYYVLDSASDGHLAADGLSVCLGVGGIRCPLVALNAVLPDTISWYVSTSPFAIVSSVVLQHTLAAPSDTVPTPADDSGMRPAITVGRWSV